VRFKYQLKAQEPAALQDFDPADVGSGSIASADGLPATSGLPLETDMVNGWCPSLWR
jgi:hypothetical protein